MTHHIDTIATGLIDNAIARNAVTFNRHGVGSFTIDAATEALFTFDKKYHVYDGLMDGPVAGNFQVRQSSKRRAAYIIFNIDEPEIEYAA